MDINPILSELKAERNRIDQAIAALESLDGTATATSRATAVVAKAASKQAKKRGLTPAGRRRMKQPYGKAKQRIYPGLTLAGGTARWPH
jgi:hypothetical protein